MWCRLILLKFWNTNSITNAVALEALNFFFQISVGSLYVFIYVCCHQSSLLYRVNWIFFSKTAIWSVLFWSSTTTLQRLSSTMEMQYYFTEGWTTYIIAVVFALISSHVKIPEMATETDVLSFYTPIPLK